MGCKIDDALFRHHVNVLIIFGGSLPTGYHVDTILEIGRPFSRAFDRMHKTLEQLNANLYEYVKVLLSMPIAAKGNDLGLLERVHI